MPARQAIDARAFGLMILLCALWGLQQVAIKAVASDIAPIFQLALRSGVAALLVGLLMRRRGERLALAGGNWRPGIVIGVLFTLEFLLLGEGLRYTSASHVVVFLYTSPIFAAIGLHWNLPAERLRPRQWLGIAVAFAGIGAAFLGHPPVSGSSPFGDLLALMAGASWGATTVVIRCTTLSEAAPAETLLYQLASAFVLLTLGALLTGRTTVHPTPLVGASLFFQSVIVTFWSYLVWFWLLRTYLASRLGVLSFMTPLFGIAFGVWLLDEQVDPGFALGALLVTAGILLVTARFRGRNSP